MSKGCKKIVKVIGYDLTYVAPNGDHSEIAYWDLNGTLINIKWGMYWRVVIGDKTQYWRWREGEKKVTNYTSEHPSSIPQQYIDDSEAS